MVQTEQTTEMQAPHPDIAAWENPPRILVVDDEPLNVQVLCEVLADFGQTSFATGGAKALELAERERPDLILLDVMMPEMYGYSVCIELKARDRTRDIPIIFVTALGMDDDEAKGIELGAIDYITKPFSAPVVRARVRSQLVLKRYRDYLSQVAYIDGLTGVPNRRNFDDRIDAAWRDSVLRNSPLSLALVDIDFFKQYNDHYGHGPGDECLRRVAGALKIAAQPFNAFIARYGGEEFACILESTDEATAAERAERLRAAVEAQAMPHAPEAGSEIVTVSIGTAARSLQSDETLRDMFQRADNNLYAAKRLGRNCVISG
ncbi:MAG: diguanylate cyclase [Sneathiellaceae bacterium]